MASDKTIAQIIVGPEGVQPWTQHHARYLESWIKVVDTDLTKIEQAPQLTTDERVALIDTNRQISNMLRAMRRSLGSLLP